MVYLHNWANGDKTDVIRDFEAPADALDGADVLVAAYEYESYDGEAYVLFRRGGKLLEVSGSHCSCYGLEGQWEPEETAAETLLARIERGGDWYIHGVKDAVLAAISQHGPDACSGRHAESVMTDWHCAANSLPEPGTRIVILYDDGSGATLGMWTGDTLIDSDGEGRALFDDAGVIWAPLPAGFRLWCELRSDDPFDFSAAFPATGATA